MSCPYLYDCNELVDYDTYQNVCKGDFKKCKIFTDLKLKPYDWEKICREY